MGLGWVNPLLPTDSGRKKVSLFAYHPPLPRSWREGGAHSHFPPHWSKTCPLWGLLMPIGPQLPLLGLLLPLFSLSTCQSPIPFEGHPETFLSICLPRSFLRLNLTGPHSLKSADSRHGQRCVHVAFSCVQGSCSESQLSHGQSEQLESTGAWGKSPPTTTTQATQLTQLNSALGQNGKGSNPAPALGLSGSAPVTPGPGESRPGLQHEGKAFYKSGVLEPS